MVRLRLRRLLIRAGAHSAEAEEVLQCQSESTHERAQAVLHLLAPLTPKEVEYCNEACIARVLKAKGNHVSKAAKQLRATLAWRANLDLDYLTADDFSAELAKGSAYVAGHDEHSRPVLIVRLQPESLSNHSQKQFLRYIVFCMEVAIRCMPSAVEQCILIFDACCLKKGTPGLSAIVQLLKVIGEHYPERVARTFVVDAPPMFYLLWKGVGKFFDLKMREKLRFVFSRDYISPSTVNPSALVEANTLTRAGTLSGRNLERDDQQTDLEEQHQKVHRGNPYYATTSAQASVCTPHLITTSDTMKPQVTQTPTSPSRPAITTLASLLSSSSFSLAASSSSSASTSLPSSSMLSKLKAASKSSSTSSLLPSFMSSSTLLPAALHHSTTAGPALTSDKNQARSLSFASTISSKKEDTAEFRSFRADARPRRVREEGSSRRWTDLTFGFSKKEDLSGGSIDTAPIRDKNYALFRPYYTAFLATPYSEVAYRARMKPPLAGLISILGPDIKLRQPSFSLHTYTAMEAMLHHLHLD